jgi:hypothetical protein
MPASLVDGNSLLAVDVGAVTTRAAYFDIVEGQYRFIGMGQCPTTNFGASRNIVLGVQLAVEHLQNLIGKQLMDDEGRLLIPSQPDGTGVDGMVTTVSAGMPIKTLIVGLLPEVSLKSIEKLAHTTYTRVVDGISLNDTRRLDEQVNAINRHSPELVLIAGGVDGGATYSINNLIEMVGLSAYLMPEGQRPAILYAGNRNLVSSIRSALASIASELVVCPNVRPALEVEDLGPAQRELANLTVNIRQRQMPELEDLRVLSGGVIMPSSYAQGRMVRFLSSYYGENKFVLSVDAGAASISMAASFGENLYLNVFPQFGLGEPLAGLLKHTTLDEIARWLPMEIPAETVRNYLYQKSLYPQCIPATREELFIEQAIVRQNLLLATQMMVQRLPGRYRRRSGLLPLFEPILAGGAALTNAPSLGQKLLMLLDGLQPAGITTLVLDQNNLLSMLGVAAEVNSLLPVQVMDAGALSYLATVVSPVSNADYGTPIVRVKLIREDGTAMTSEVNMGNLQILPLDSGQTARLELRPLRNADVGLGPGHAGALDVIGSSLGVVIDARGRPLHLPSHAAERIKLHQKWLKTVGG